MTVYAAPGQPGRLVAYQSRYENFIGYSSRTSLTGRRGLAGTGRP